MLSTSELLASHHDAKLRDPARSGGSTPYPAVSRPDVSFRAGLRVKIEIDGDNERPGMAHWASEGAVLTLTD